MTTKQDPIIGVHLDLKGMAHQPRHLPRLLSDLAGRGVNTVLVEYEDLFPFQRLDIAADDAATWSKQTLRRFQAAARANGIDIIPLQQCLGHLEYVYRWDRYRPFAENRAYPSTVKLSSRPARAMVVDMLEQVIAAHGDSRYVHLGMDEARAMRAAKGKSLFETFFDYLRDLLDVTTSHGKTAIVWSDMLEDHFEALPLDEFRDKVIFMPWDYSTRGKRTAVARIGGFRMTRQWLDEPQNLDGPPIGPGRRFLEDLPAATKRLIKPFHDGRWFRPLPQVDLWTSRGMRVIGATAIRSSSHGPILPRYHDLRGNIHAWADAIRRTRQMGLVATSWARGTTFCPPNFPIETAWPLVDELVGAMKPAARRRPFWPGVPAKTTSRLIGSLGRCRGDWSIEGEIAAEMESLRAKVKDHRYEWDATALLARVIEVRRRAEYVLSEMDYFHADVRLIADEWQRRLRDQAAALKQIAAMRREVRAHFGKRYHGQAFEEWVRDLFDLHESRLRAARPIAQRKKRIAKKRYAK